MRASAVIFRLTGSFESGARAGGSSSSPPSSGAAGLSGFAVGPASGRYETLCIFHFLFGHHAGRIDGQRGLEFRQCLLILLLLQKCDASLYMLLRSLKTHLVVLKLVARVIGMLLQRVIVALQGLIIVLRRLSFGPIVESLRRFVTSRQEEHHA
jgi:hypothetical protein